MPAFPDRAMYTLLVFVHVLATSMALGAIVATDLRLLSKLSQDRIRIAPPNEFVARIVMVSLLLLWLTGGAIVWHGVQANPNYLDNPKLLVKIGLVVVLSVNAFVLHKVTFPRLARGRRVARWRIADWVLVAVPVGVSNFLWMFVAFLGVARAWNGVMPARDILEIAAALFLIVQFGVFTILATAGRDVEPDRLRWPDRVARSLALVGNLGRRDSPETQVPEEPRRKRRRSSSRAARAVEAGVPVAGEAAAPSLPPALSARASTRPALRLVDTDHRRALSRKTAS